MSRCGDVYENKVTGEYVVVLRGTEDRGTGPGSPISRRGRVRRWSASTAIPA